MRIIKFYLPSNAVQQFRRHALTTYCEQVRTALMPGCYHLFQRFITVQQFCNSETICIVNSNASTYIPWANIALIERGFRAASLLNYDCIFRNVFLLSWMHLNSSLWRVLIHVYNQIKRTPLYKNIMIIGLL